MCEKLHQSSCALIGGRLARWSGMPPLGALAEIFWKLPHPRGNIFGPRGGKWKCFFPWRIRWSCELGCCLYDYKRKVLGFGDAVKRNLGCAWITELELVLRFINLGFDNSHIWTYKNLNIVFGLPIYRI